MEMPDIRSLLPHSGTMVLLDRVVSIEGDELCAEVSIRPDSLFCGADGVGAWVGIEYMAQAVAAHAGYAARLRGEPIKMGFLLGTRRYESSRPNFTPDSNLHVHVRNVLQGDNGLASFECWIDIDGEQVATATITAFQPENAHDFLKESLE